MKPWNEIAYLTALASMDAPTQSCNGICAGFEDLVGRLGGPGGAAVRAAMDPWGSPRVPKLRRTPGYDQADPERWLAVPWNESVQEYSSLVGARYYNLDPKFVGNVTFAMGDNYIDVSNWTCVGSLEDRNYSDPVQYHMTEVSVHGGYQSQSELAFASYFLKYFGKVGGGEERATFSERFMQDPSAAFVRHDNPYINLCNISMELFEDRLGLILNTFLDSTWNPQGVLGAGVLNPSLLWNATSTIEAPLPPIYALDIPWISTYFAATTVMMLAALGSLVMRYHLVTPPVLGSVGGLAKDSPYFAHLRPAGNSTEGGEDISKRLRRERVGMVDVQAGSDVGRMALAPAEMGEKVRKGRWYE
ncbi:hypothetical protein PG991_011917 [Apiospora marii]|uniref:Uncharacterized protein n=1 Tax=Apiospora marii TaxID=335849 RepID=A0ABR1RFM1_9PEZI